MYSSIDLDIKPLAIRSCRATRSRIAKRDPSPESSSGESEFSEYELSPKIRPTRHRRMQGTSEERSVSPPLVDIKSEPISPSSSLRAGSIKGKAKPKAKAKRGSGRKGEPRRTQNMVAQKKYRDKRVNAAHLVCFSFNLSLSYPLTVRCLILLSSSERLMTRPMMRHHIGPLSDQSLLSIRSRSKVSNSV